MQGHYNGRKNKKYTVRDMLYDISTGKRISKKCPQELRHFLEKHKSTKTIINENASEWLRKYN